MRILIVKTSSMGDVVHALPAVSDMAQALPDLQIDWLVEKSFAAIPAQHRAVDRIITLQWRKWRKSLRSHETRTALSQWRAEMKRHPYDLIIDMQGLLKSVGFACFADGPRVGYDWRSIREPLASLFYQRRARVPRQLHAVDRCRQLAAQALGYPLPDTPPDFGMRLADQFWRPADRPYAVLIPCASRPEKLWPESDWIAVGHRLSTQGLAIAVMWGNQQEQERAQTIAQAIGGTVPPFLTVADAASSLGQAQVVVGLDTGMTHLAAAQGCTTIGIYCDHEPGLAGVTGPGRVVSLGGKGQVPSLQAVLDALAVS